jgi:hypothetical protein
MVTGKDLGSLLVDHYVHSTPAIRPGGCSECLLGNFIRPNPASGRNTGNR